METGARLRYTTLPRWNGTAPAAKNETYSMNFFGDVAVAAVDQHPVTQPMFMYLPWQCVHVPVTPPPSCDNATTGVCEDPLRSMLYVADDYVGRLADRLDARGMWDNTLFVFSADNGGVDTGNNYPLRGEKHTSWEGGMRVTAFLAGGLLPENVRGTHSDAFVHVVDWYPTLCKLAGVDPTDDPPVAPLPVDPTRPDLDIYH